MGTLNMLIGLCDCGEVMTGGIALSAGEEHAIVVGALLGPLVDDELL